MGAGVQLASAKTKMAQPQSVTAPKPGKIVRVSYGATVSLPGYENIRYDLTADVGPGEKWQDVFERLRNVVKQHKERVKEDGY